MLKRIRYVSEFSRQMSAADLEQLTARSAASNAEVGITGVLVATGSMFFQVLEGDPARVDELFARISGDGRHRQVLVLEVEQGDLARLFPGWPMRKLDLSDESVQRLGSVRAILKAIHAQRIVMQNLRGALEQAVWQEVVSSGALKEPGA
ncbi:MAG: BLUF domain-containing protein [Deltaproteobacteria bacterium]|nr:BLUF domain-containing protein [Deltaproteobacteria bacterium]